MRFVVSVCLVCAISLIVFAAPNTSFRLATAEDDKIYRSMLPPTEDKILLELYKKHLIFYTDKEMPRAYQFDFALGTTNTFHDAKTDPSISFVKPELPPGQPNLEFPWKDPAGTHRCPPSILHSVRFVHLPAAIVYWYEDMFHDVHPQRATGLRWEYPEGTVFGEILLQKDSSDYSHTFELRTRTKSNGKWLANLYRPFPTRKSYVAACAENGVEVGEPKITIGRLKNNHPRKEVINREAVVDEIPELDEKIVKKLLKKPFVSALGQEWITVDGKEGFAPTSKAKFGIVPKNYDGAYLNVDSKKCMACHEGTLKHADDFQMDREWYGRVRGSDAIFSFHPVDPNYFGNSRSHREIVIRKSLVEAGLVKKWVKE